jgi:hypothetical protein
MENATGLETNPQEKERLFEAAAVRRVPMEMEMVQEIVEVNTPALEPKDRHMIHNVVKNTNARTAALRSTDQVSSSNNSTEEVQSDNEQPEPYVVHDLQTLPQNVKRIYSEVIKRYPTHFLGKPQLTPANIKDLADELDIHPFKANDVRMLKEKWNARAYRAAALYLYHNYRDQTKAALKQGGDCLDNFLIEKLDMNQKHLVRSVEALFKNPSSKVMQYTERLVDTMEHKGPIMEKADANDWPKVKTSAGQTYAAQHLYKYEVICHYSGLPVKQKDFDKYVDKKAFMKLTFNTSGGINSTLQGILANTDKPGFQIANSKCCANVEVVSHKHRAHCYAFFVCLRDIAVDEKIMCNFKLLKADSVLECCPLHVDAPSNLGSCTEDQVLDTVSQSVQTAESSTAENSIPSNSPIHSFSEQEQLQVHTSSPQTSAIDLSMVSSQPASPPAAQDPRQPPSNLSVGPSPVSTRLRKKKNKRPSCSPVAFLANCALKRAKSHSNRKRQPTKARDH